MSFDTGRRADFSHPQLKHFSFLHQIGAWGHPKLKKHVFLLSGRLSFLQCEADFEGSKLGLAHNTYAHEINKLEVCYE